MSTSSKWKDFSTEAIHSGNLAMDKASTDGLVALMLSEDQQVVAAVSKERTRIAVGADLLTAAVRKDGRRSSLTRKGFKTTTKRAHMPSLGSVLRERTRWSACPLVA